MRPLSRNQLKEITFLTSRKGRERQRKYLAEGVRLILSALACGAPVESLLVADDIAPDADLLEKARRKGIPAYEVSKADFPRISDVETSQGVIAVLRSELGDISEARQSSRLLVLDGVQDPGNAGTIIRASAWFGVDGVIALPGTVDLHNPKVVRGSMGGFWDVKQFLSTDAAETLAQLREAGFRISAADMNGVPVREWAPAQRTALILGSESHGISPAAAEWLDERVVIPSSGGAGQKRGVESLNVAMAATILLHHWSD